ncbi:MAG: sensor domain-containing diguanylate cyclase [Gaiellales bacterium]
MSHLTPTTVSRLRGLLEVTRLVRDETDTGRLLDAIAATIAESLGYDTVVINLYRPAWNDFEVTTVHGNEDARAELLGDTLPWEAWSPLLDERYCRGGAYLIPHGTFDWTNDTGRRYVPGWTPSDDPDAWHPDDELFVPMLHSAGHMLGILSVGEPVCGRRPETGELEVLVAVAEHAALALEGVQDNAAAQRHKLALDHLLQVSSQMTETLATDAVLHAVCRGIHDALGFQKVRLDLPDAITGVFSARATIGWTDAELAHTGAMSAWELAPLLDPEFETDGCFLLTQPDAMGRLPAGYRAYESRLNGSGRWAWNRNWLAVPLIDRQGQMIGVVWADDPADRLLPSRPLMQTLRLFANQATSALESAKRFQDMRFLAEHDTLTQLLNRRAFTDRLEIEIGRAQRYHRPFALVLCDLDGFKTVNDRYGHLTGDDVLARIAASLQRSVRTADAVFRIGGDEFAAILPETDPDQLVRVLLRLSSAVVEAGADMGVQASLGAAVFPADGEDEDSLFRAAEAAMYARKRLQTGDSAAA